MTNTTSPSRCPAALRAALILALAASLFLRLWQLDRFLTVDEPNWRTRSIEFWQGIKSGDYIQTCRTEHPGVLTMWSGVAAHHITEALRSADVRSPALRSLLYPRGYDQGLGLYPETFWARLIIALATWLGIIAVCVLGRRFLSPTTNAYATILLSLDPFYLAFSRLHHLDGLLTCFMALSLYALLAYAEHGDRRLLLLSGLMAGMATLNKAPGVVLGFGMLGILGWYGWQKRSSYEGWLRRWLIDALLWSGVAVAIAFAIWPAMWTNPGFVFRRVIEGSRNQTANPHELGNFFWFASRDDPGPFFYPVAWALRTTPFVLIGLIALPFVRRNVSHRAPVMCLLLFSLGYTILMTFSLKKFDRYILPVFALLCAPAALGWEGLIRRVLARWRSAVWLQGGVALAIVAACVAMVLPTRPYYTAYYNPVFGGPRVAQKVLLIGWGEGLEQAAEYLNAKPDAASLHVSSMSSAELAPFFRGTTTNALETSLVDPDYFLTYASRVQRGFAPELLTQIKGQEPEFVARSRNGVTYAWVYENRVYRADINDLLSLVSAEPGGGLLLLNTSPTAVRHTTFDVQPVITERRDYMLTELEWRRAQHDAVWFMTFAGIHDKSSEALSEALEQVASLDRTETRGAVTASRYRLTMPLLTWPQGDHGRDCQVGEAIAFRGYACSEAVEEGKDLHLSLYWLAERPVHADYKVFVHLVGAGETIIAQSDSEPEGARRRTNTWQAGQMVLDDHVLEVPDDTPAGDYRLYVGMYDPTTMQRLPVVDENGSRLPDDRLPIGSVSVTS